MGRGKDEVFINDKFHHTGRFVFEKMANEWRNYEISGKNKKFSWCRFFSLETDYRCYYVIKSPIDSILYFVSLLLANFNVYYTVKTKQEGKKIKYNICNRTTWLRARTLFRKEPETIEWIDSMRPGETLWDIGANIGVYTTYASAKGLSCFSFEPGAANYYVLNKNIEINQYKNVKAYCLAFSDTTSLGCLNMSITDVGGALSNFEGESRDSNNFTQGMIGFTVDDFVKFVKQDIPEHIKIDVDGMEDKIIQGMRETIKNQRLKSVLVEINYQSAEQYSTITDIFFENGFILYEHERFVRGYTCNYIFIRT